MSSTVEIQRKNPSCTAFTPTCCKEHKMQCNKMRNLDTSRWKFVSEPALLHPKKFDPFSRATPSSESRAKGMKELDDQLDQIGKAALFNLAAEVMNEAPSTKEMAKQEEALDTIDAEVQIASDFTASEKHGILEKYKVPEIKTNPYLTLLNRLDEEDGKRAPSIEDKLKLTEDRLRVSMMEFCKHSTRLATMKEEDEGENEGRSPEELFIKPETIQELFKPELFEPSLCPPIPFVVQELEPPALVVEAKSALQQKEWLKKERKMHEKFKQGYYLPPETWFAPEKKEVPVVSSEELELLNSFSAKEFLKFLDERKKEPPKVLRKLQEKVLQIQMDSKEQERKT